MHVVMKLNTTYHTYFLLYSAMILLASSCYKYYQKKFHEMKIMSSNKQCMFIYFILWDQETDWLEC
jgi:hypothetical protein